MISCAMNCGDRSVTISSGNSGGPTGRRWAIARSSASTFSPVAAEIGTTSTPGWNVDPRLDHGQQLGLGDAIDLVERR